MNLYLIRHGDSEKSSLQKKDHERELTASGKKITEQAALYWKKIIPPFDHILSSPFIRSVQTAEIIASVFKLHQGVVIDKKLSPGSSTEDLIEIVQAYDSKNIAVVGHQPDMSEHISNLISGSTAFVEFKKSAIAKLSFGSKIKSGKGTLNLLIPPEILIK
jgi:phosphohistidine phosphatase